MSMSMSKIFYKVKAHLLKQGEKSMDEEYGSCRYHGDYGRSCAVGCLITANMYDDNLEGEGVHSPVVISALKPIIGTQRKKRKSKLELLDALQGVHDEYPPNVWESKLEELRPEFNIA